MSVHSALLHTHGLWALHTPPLCALVRRCRPLSFAPSLHTHVHASVGAHELACGAPVQAPAPPRPHLPSFLFLKSEARRLAQLEAARAKEAVVRAEAAAEEAKARRAMLAEEVLEEAEQRLVTKAAAAAGGCEEGTVRVELERVAAAGGGASAGIHAGAGAAQTEASQEGSRWRDIVSSSRSSRDGGEAGLRSAESFGRALGRKLSSIFGAGGSSGR